MIYAIINCQDKIPSFNAVLRMNKRERNRTTQKCKEVFAWLQLASPLRPIEEPFKLEVRYNTAHDVDGISFAVKCFIDAMIGKYIKDDNPSFFKSFTITHSRKVQKGVIQFRLLKF